MLSSSRLTERHAAALNLSIQERRLRRQRETRLAAEGTEEAIFGDEDGCGTGATEMDGKALNTGRSAYQRDE